LAAVYSVTKPRILEQKRLALEGALKTTLPDADVNAIIPVKSDEEVVYYKGFSKPDTTGLVGYSFVAHNPGYSSVIETMVGVDTSGAIIGMKILSQVETPGLGTKIEEIKYGENDPWFQRQFIGRSAADCAVDKDGGEIQSITGATISSRAVANAIMEGFRRLNQDRRSLPESGTDEADSGP
jgi:electron transport complex protein RnfG